MGPRVWTRCSEDLKKKKKKGKKCLSKSRCSCATGITMTRCGVCDAVQNESVGASRLSPWVTSGPPPDSTSSDAGQMFPIISYARNLLLPRQQPEKGLAVGATMGESRFRTGLLIDSLALSDAIYRHGNPLRLSLYLLSLLLSSSSSSFPFGKRVCSSFPVRSSIPRGVPPFSSICSIFVRRGKC